MLFFVVRVFFFSVRLKSKSPGVEFLFLPTFVPRCANVCQGKDSAIRGVTCKESTFFFVLMTGKLAFGFHSSLNNELECKVR